MKISTSRTVLATFLISFTTSQCAHRDHNVNTGSEETAFPVVQTLEKNEGHFCNVQKMGTCLKNSTKTILENRDLDKASRYKSLATATDVCIQQAECRPASSSARNLNAKQWEQF